MSNSFSLVALLWAFSITLTACSPRSSLQATPSGHQDPVLEKNAAVWERTVVSLYDTQQYSKLKQIDHMGEDIFKDTSIWSDPKFLSFWDTWSRRKALLSWEVGNGNLGMWKVAEERKKDAPTMGLKREQNGQWWLVFVKPQNMGGVSYEGWECNPRCVISISTQGVTRSFTMRPPEHQEFDKVHTLGVVAPSYLFTDDVQTWKVVFPDQESYTFDVSFAPSVCDKIFGTCGLRP